jgi:TolB protein
MIFTLLYKLYGVRQETHLITQFYKKHAGWQLLPGLFLLIALGLCIPKVVSAQTVPPPPPIEQRWEPELQNRPTGQAKTLQPNAPEAGFIPWSRVAAQSYRDNNWEIYAGGDDFLTLTRLTNDGSSDIQPRINRGANSIVFASNRDGDYEIFRMNFDGSGLTKLTENAFSDVVPIWSPDGTKILFQSYQDGQSEIYVMNADGSGQTRLTNDPNYDGQPDWSPDGSRILFSSNRSGSYRIWVANADGSNPSMLSGQNYSSHPKWSPDGSQIAYDADGDGNGWQELWLMNVDGSNQHNVMAGYINTDYWAGSWSPNGRYIAYTHIEYVYYQSKWYWTAGHLSVWDTRYNNIAGVLGQGVEWSPDWQSIDADPPVSTMSALPAQSPASFLVSWNGSDNGNFGGIKGYDVQVKDGLNGTWTPLLNQPLDTSATYLGTGGHTYYFRVRSCDDSYNMEAWPADYDTFTMVEALPPVTSVHALPPFSRTGFTVTWDGNDPGGSGIAKYDIQYRIGADGTWINWQANTPTTSAQFYGDPGNIYYFRSRAVDNAQNVEAWPAGNGDTQVTIYSWKISGVIHDNVGIPVAGSKMSLDPALVLTSPSDSGGNFVGYGRQDGPTYTTTWAKNGYGILPLTTFPSNTDIQHEVTLPPANNLINNGYFETGSLSPETWQSVGALPSSITNAYSHTDQFAAQLGEIPATAWKDAEKVGDGLYYVRNHMVVDSKGVIHAVWLTGVQGTYDPQVYYSSKSQNGTWTTPVNISNMAGAFMPDIAVDRSDNLHVVWRDYSNAAIGTYYAFKPKNGNWTTPIRIFDELQDPRIKVDATDTIHLVGSLNNENGIQYASQSNGIWSSLSTISSKGSAPCLIIDLEGTVHMLWSDTGKIQYSYKPLHKNWSSAIQISSDNSLHRDPDLIVDSAGTLYGVWNIDANNDTEANSIEFRMKPLHGEWGTLEKTGGAGGANNPQVVLNFGKIEVVYSRGSGGDIYYTERKAENKWAHSIKLSTPPNYWARYPSIVVGLDGSTHLLWFEFTNSNPGNAHGQITYRRSAIAAQTDDAILTQIVTIPETMFTPTLAFFYQLEGGSAYTGANFNVNLQTTNGNVNLFSSTTNTLDWTFQSLDLSAWRGQTVTLEFRTHQVAGGMPVRALVDDVSLGSAYSDSWVSAFDTRGHPGDEVTYILNCGNRGGAIAYHSQMTVELPPDLTFVSAEPAPTSQTPVLTWDLGNLPAKNGACSVRLTTKIGPTVTIPKSLISQVKLTTDTNELELENNLKQVVVLVASFNYLPTVGR